MVQRNMEWSKLEYRIIIAEEFSRTPGARYRDDGRFSGQEFREDVLEPKFLRLAEGDYLVVVFDGAAGYATSFLEEAFGGLARKHGAAKVLSKLRFVSEEEPLLIQEVELYVNGKA